MPDNIDLGYAFNLPPEKAVAYFRSKGRRVSFDWHSMWKEAHARAFTTANCAKLDVLRDLQLGIRKALKEGKSEKWFVQTLEPVLRSKGWWGPRDEVNPSTGKIIRVQQGSRWRLALIARQNVQNSVNAGRWQEQVENRDNQPYLRYVAMQDMRTRPDHRMLHDKVFPVDDPFWMTHYPPNGWNCRCHVEGVSEARLKRRGWQVESSEGKIVTREISIRDRRSGEVTRRTVTGYKVSNKQTVWTDAGFDYNSGQVAMADNILRDHIEKLSIPPKRERDRPVKQALYEQAKKVFNNAQARHEGFAQAVRQWLKDDSVANRSAILGLMDWRDLTYAKLKGADVNGIVLFTDDRLQHARRGVHTSKQIEVPEEAYPDLARMFDKPEAVYWDEEHQNLLYVFPDTKDEWCRVMPVNVPTTNKSLKRRMGALDGVATFYRLPRKELTNGRELQKIR